MTIKPELVDVQRAIAEWFLAQGNTKKAVARYLTLADHLRKHDQGAAAAAIERALAINPQHPRALEYQRMLIEQFAD